MPHWEVVSFILNYILQDVIEKGEKQPNLTIGILVSILVVFITVIFRVLFGGKKPTVSFLLYSVFDLFCALFKLSIFFFFNLL